MMRGVGMVLRLKNDSRNGIFQTKNDSWNGIFQTKMALFIDEKGDGAEADDAVVEGVWLPPWQELPMTEHNDKSAPTGKF